MSETPPHPGDSQLPQTEKQWSLFSRYGHILICLSERPDMRVSEIAEVIGATERTVRSLISVLEEDGVIIRHREGRRNRYSLELPAPLRLHPAETGVDLQPLLDLVINARAAGAQPVLEKPDTGLPHA